MRQPLPTGYRQLIRKMRRSYLNMACPLTYLLTTIFMNFEDSGIKLPLKQII